MAAALITTATNKLLYYFAAYTNPFERHDSFKTWHKLVILLHSDHNNKSDTASGKALLLGYLRESSCNFCSSSRQGVGVCPKACSAFSL